jgi:phosphohistidine phosphatase SixA
MKSLRACLSPALALMLAGCATMPDPASVATTFVLVRHAEKANDDPRDPGLSEAGRTRAANLARGLADAPLRAVYVTAYRRTRETGGPAAAMHRLRLAVYEARLPAADMAARLRADHREGVVLVVGHSNTVPEIAAALCACPVAPMRDDEYDRRIEIRIGPDGNARIEQGRY